MLSSGTATGDDDDDDDVEDMHYAVSAAAAANDDPAGDALAYALFQQIPPRTHLETFSITQMRQVVALFITVIVLAVVFGTTILAFTFTYGTMQTTKGRYDLFCECVLRTLASAGLTLGLVFFPARILLTRYRTHTALTATESVLIFSLVLLSVIPGFSIYGVAVSWLGALEFQREFASFVAAPRDASLSSVLFSVGEDGFLLSAVSSSLGIVFQYAFLFLLIDLEAYPAEFSRDAAAVKRSSSSSASQQQRKDGLRRSESGSITEYETLLAHQNKRNLACTSATIALWIQRNPMARIKSAWNRAQRAWSRIRFRYVWLILCVYFATLVAFSVEMRFYVSYVPLVSMISVIRVCAADASMWSNSTASRNSTLLNSTVYTQSTFSGDLGLCSPRQPEDNSPFWIAIGCGIFFFLDLSLLANLYVALPKAREHLSTLPYMTCRPYMLGFLYYRFLTWYTFAALILMGVLVTTVLPVSSYIVTDVEFDTEGDMRTNVVVRPLFQVGVTAGNFGFGPCFLIIVNWVVLLCYGNLPPRSTLEQLWCCFSRRPWCCSRPVATATAAAAAKRAANQSSSTPPSPLHRQHRGRLAARTAKLELPQGAYLRHESDIDLLQARGVLPGDLYHAEECVLQRQVRTEVFVLETAVLMFHFMNLAYNMREQQQQLVKPAAAAPPEAAAAPVGQEVPVAAATTPPPDSSSSSSAATAKQQQQREDAVAADELAELQRMVEDDAFKLLLHAQDKASDTHAYVFASEDRVIVSFRGSVSLPNYQVDFDSTEVVFEPAVHVKPLVEGFANPLYASNLASTLPPLVHRGFLRTYTLVRPDILQCVSRLMNADGNNHHPRRQRVLMVTGHSLGGGLATLCSMDLALALHLPPHRVALTVFGSPMAGNLSFVTRFNRVVRCAHRLETANDVISQLPFQSPFNEISLRGWFHVGAQVLLMPNGNGVIAPSPIERYMVHKTSSSIVAHFRLSYATALAAWAIRANEMHAKWWNSAIYEFLHYADFSPIPRPIREALLRDLRRPGIPYLLHNVLYRDMAFDTSELDEEEEAEDEDEAASEADSVRRFTALVHNVQQSRNEAERGSFNAAVLKYAQQETAEAARAIKVMTGGGGDEEEGAAAVEASVESLKEG